MQRWIIRTLIVLGLVLGAGQVTGLLDGTTHAYADEGGGDDG